MVWNQKIITDEVVEKNKIIKKNDYHSIPISAMFTKETIFDRLHIRVSWQGKDIHSYFIETFEHHYPNELFKYNLYWRIPYYAPLGQYEIKILLFGITMNSTTAEAV